MLAIVVPMVECELEEFFAKFLGLQKSVSRINSKFIIVVQHRNRLSGTSSDLIQRLKYGGASVLETNRMNLSAARNIGLKEAKKITSFKKILFLDSDASIVKLEAIDNHKNEVLLNQFNFVKFSNVLHFLLGSKNYTLFNIFKCPFIAQFIYNIDEIKVTFDETVGPGEDTIFKSGEDLKFILANITPKTLFTRESSNIIYHPLRDEDLNEKRYKYATGQINSLFLAFKAPQIRVRVFSLLFLMLFLCNSLILLRIDTSHGNLGKYRLVTLFKRMFR